VIGRRAVLAGAGAGALPLAGCADDLPAVSLGGADVRRGHAMRDRRFPEPSSERETRIAVVGGGVAGLTAAWTLAEAGVADVRLVELEDRAGGNARGGANAVSAFPLGAHYLPIPNAESRGVLRLLERLGIVTGWDGGRPVFDPYQVVSDPEERLLHLGRWQEGLVPTRGLSLTDARTLRDFFAAMAGYRDRVGADGRPAFAIPLAFSSRDPDLLALDRLSFADWLDRRGWRSPVLRGHVRYACRDDYGTEPEHVSAWAGIHYFAGRRGAAANVTGDAVLTWPEGNARLTGRMAARLGGRIDAGRVAFRVVPHARGAAVDLYDAAARRSERLVAEAVVLAVPRFVAARIVDPALGGADAAAFSYAPWLVANVTVDRAPGGPGFQLAWDNVSWTSGSLGYVAATHQSLTGTDSGAAVLTWYTALSDTAPADARRLLLTRPAAEWERVVRDDLLATNPDLEGAVRRIDLWRWGHAMVRPVPGFVWGDTLAAAARPRPPLYFAHSDLSGLSIFEEAHYRGALAAEAAMRDLGLPFTPSLV